MKKSYEQMKAAREIVKSRWRKGGFGAPLGPRCALGALKEACGFDFLENSDLDYHNDLDIIELADYRKIKSILEKCVPTRYFGNVIAFNDNKNTSQKDVIEMFNCAVRLADKENMRFNKEKYDADCVDGVERGAAAMLIAEATGDYRHIARVGLAEIVRLMDAVEQLQADIKDLTDAAGIA